MRLKIILPFLLLCTSMHALTPKEVTNVQLTNRNCYVTDMCGAFTDAERADLDARCVRLRQEAGVELAIVVVDEIDGDDEYQFAYDLFNLWHIGDKRNNSGVLWLYVKSLRAMKIETGVGVEGLLTDGFLKRMLETTVFPLMREEKTYDAFCDGLDMIEAQLTSDQARQELAAKELEDRTSLVDIISAYFALGFLLLILLSILFYVQWNKLKGDNCQKYTQFTKTNGAYPLIKLCAFIFPIPLLFLFRLARRCKNSLRYMPMKCPKCGHEMRVLSENEEDLYLTHTQQEEENVHTVDYDVWLCPDCGATNILKYENYASPLYKKCPNCGGHTYKEVSEKVIVAPTPLTPGRGERIYRCTSCGVVNRTPFTIPPVPIIVGGGRRGGGGGFSGGGFGGGFSGGGGAGGRF